MDTKHQYEMKVINGEKSEEGHFFRAAPFQIESESGSFSVDFVPTPHHEVVYQVKHKDTVVAEYEHPFFIPDEKPEEALAAFEKQGINAKPLFHALVELNVSKQKDYRKFVEEQNDVSFTVTQPKFLAS